MNLLGKYLSKVDFESYEDFAAGARINVPPQFNFGYDVVDEYARLCPNKRALVWCNSVGKERIVTFGELKSLSNRAANMLLSYGLKKGDFVMTMLNRRWEYWVLLVACHKLGVVLVPATHLLTAKDIAFRVKGAGVKILFATAEDDVVEHVREALPKCDGLIKCMFSRYVQDFDTIQIEWAKYPDTLPEGLEIPKNEDNMLCYFTSGTSGQPKMVLHNMVYPLGHIFTAYYWQQVVDDGLHFTMAETGWAKCSWGKVYGQWLSGTAVFAYDYHGRFTPTDVLPLLAKYGITTFCAPPTIYRFLIKEDLSQYDFSSLTHCTTAGEALNAEVFNRFYEASGQYIHEGFGQTESAVILANFRYQTAIPGALGKPCPLYDLHLIGQQDDEDVAEGETGEIAIVNATVPCTLVCGYKGDEARTADARGGKYYRTGDLAYRDANGVFWFVGRADDIIKSSGYRIGPFEVESALMEHPAVLECAITGVPDETRGQIVKATIVLARGFEPSDELKKQLQDHVKHATAPYKYPRVIEFVTELPKTISGKIRRVEIRKNDNK